MHSKAGVHITVDFNVLSSNKILYIWLWSVVLDLGALR